MEGWTNALNLIGGGVGTLLNETSLGALSTSNTSNKDMSKSVTVAGVNDYDALLVDISVDSAVNGRHTSTVSVILLPRESNYSTISSASRVAHTWNSNLKSDGTVRTYSRNDLYGLYPQSNITLNLLDGVYSVTFEVFGRYNATVTSTLNGTYTARVYGIKLVDLIGG